MDMDQPDKHLLFVAHAFPPGAGGCVQRAAKFAAFLPRHGWRVTVLATQAGLYGEVYGQCDDTVLDGIPGEVEVLRAPSTETGRYEPPKRFGIPGLDRLRYRMWMRRNAPDPGRAWAQAALPAALAKSKETRFDAVLATAPPFSSLMLGRQVAAQLGLPLVVDFQDPWCLRDQPPDWRPDRLELGWEREVLAEASRVAFITPIMMRRYAARYPEYAERMSVIEHGVDLEEPVWREEVEVSRERFELVYTGLFYTTSPPDALLRGMSVARGRASEFARIARLVVAGTVEAGSDGAGGVRGLISSLGMETVIEERGFLPHAEAIGLQRSAGALLLIVNTAVTPASKCYEYVAAGRPVLAVVPRGGEAARVLGHSVMPVFAEPDDHEDIAAKLLELFGCWKRGELFDLPKPEVPREFTRAFQAEQMAELLDAACSQGARSR